MSLYQFKFYIKPSVLAHEIVARLTAPSANQQADARRWLELGYAAEKAGMRLEGADLRFPSIGLAGSPVVPSVVSLGPSPVNASTQDAVEAPVSQTQALAADADAPPVAPVFSTSTLARNLRGLSQ